MKVTVLIENHRNPEYNFQAEHGLSIYVEHENRRFLIDTGQSGKFLQNAFQMKIDLSEIDYVIITHGHYDHIGGLHDFLNFNSKAKIILSPNVLKNDFFSIKNDFKRFIGTSFTNDFINRDRFIFVQNTTDFPENFSVIAKIEKRFQTPSANQFLYKNEGSAYIKDDFDHEIVPCFTTQNGLVVFTACAHSGLLNILHAVNEKFKPLKIETVIGGFHLPDMDDENQFESEHTIKEFGELLAKNDENTVFYTGHCTGSNAFRLLKKILKERLSEIYTGFKINIK